MSNLEKAEVVERHAEEIEILQDRINELNAKKVTGYQHHSSEARGRFKKLTLGNTYEVKSQTASVRAATFIWNYNTCESILLCTCVIVAAMGVMFESAYLESGSYAQETLSYMTITLIGSSTTYYAIVCWSEIVGALNPRCSLSFLSGGALEDSDDEEEEIENAENFEMADGKFVNVGAQLAEKEEADALNDANIGILTEDQQIKLQRLKSNLLVEKKEMDTRIENIKKRLDGRPASKSGVEQIAMAAYGVRNCCMLPSS